MKNTSLIATIMMSGTALLPMALAVPDVYPTPQHNQLADTTTQVTEVSVLFRQPDSTGGLWDKLPSDNEGAYALEITDGKLTVYTNTQEGSFYAKQTLSQLLQDVPEAQNAQQDPFPRLSLEEVAKLAPLPKGVLVDWPDLPFRGAVEGYYGTPWSFESRMSQFAFYGRNKLNMYIYAPKDDPYHHGRGCYEPYPATKAQEIKSLVEFARQNHVRFVWAIHPANTVKWDVDGGKTQLDALCNKLQLMYELGVRDFAVLVDDSSGEIGKAERQVQLCNYLLENFIRKHKDVNQTLIMCPTGYNRAWTNEKFLNTLGEGLDKTIPVMWTGNTVVNNITLDGQKWVNGNVHRPTFIWWNWPCNDFKRGRLSLGRTYGLDTAAEMKNEMSGFVANPMEHAEASKIGLFGVANYTWNITGFQSEKTWQNGIARLYPGCAEAMQVFCNHNSYLLPNNHGYFREESTHITPIAKQFQTDLEKGIINTEAVATLKNEFNLMEKAGSTLAEAENLQAFQNEAAPWIQQFTLGGRFGSYILDALCSSDRSKRLTSFFHAVDTLSQMKTVSRVDWNRGKFSKETDVEVAMYAMTPTAQAALRKVNADIYAELSGNNRPQPIFSSNVGNPHDGTLAMTDGNMNTFWSTGCAQKEGQWFSLDFGKPTVIRNIVLVMGGRRAQDYVRAGQFEFSLNGEDWLEIGRETGGHTIVVNLDKYPIRARYIRYRVTENNPKWTSICVFSVNSSAPTYVSSNMAKRPQFGVSSDKESVRINRVMEVFTIKPLEYIELTLPRPLRPTWLELNVENADLEKWGKLELTQENGQRVDIPIKIHKNRMYLSAKQLPDYPITAARITNQSNTPQEIKLTIFRLGLPEYDAETDPTLLTDGNLATFFNCGKQALDLTLPLPENTNEIVVVGTAYCEVSSATSTDRTDHTQTFRLDPNTRQITIKAPRQDNRHLYEVIFK